MKYERVDGSPDTQAPAAPTAVVAQPAGPDVRLSWNASISTDTVGYHVYRGTTPGVGTEGQPYSGATALAGRTFTDTDVEPGHTYYYVVTAIDAAGNESLASEEASITVAAVAAPTALVAAAGADGIDLSWTASTTDVVGYRVYRGTVPGTVAEGTPLSGTTAVSGTSFTDSTAEVGVTYYYVVTAVDASGNESAPSDEAIGLLTAGPDDEAPEAPEELTAEGGDGVVDLTWPASTSTDVVGYRVYRSLEPNVATTGQLISGEALVAGLAYRDTTVTNGTTYFYVIRAVDGAGNESVPSTEAHAVPRVPNDLDVKIDFATAAAVPVDGYLLDYGQAFGPRTGAHQGTGLTYGWTTEDGNPVSLVGNGRVRERPGIDPRLDSIIHMQYGDVVGTNGVDTEGTWELAVPDGLYEVTVAVGDEGGGTNGYDSQHVVNVEAAVGIEAFQGSAQNEYHVATVTVGVWDGRLTINPVGGKNTKLGYLEVSGVAMAPHVDTVLPANREVGHGVTAGVSSTIRIPYAGVGVDPTTLQGNVHLYELPGGAEVPVTVGTSGGNDVISLSPDAPLKANTTYRFVVTDKVKDNFGAAFVPFSSVFTTGAGDVIGGDEFTPLTGIKFEKVEQPVGANKFWASFAFGPDGKLYGTTIGQGLYRMTVADDGTLSNIENLGYQGRAMIGLVFDRDATADDLRLWVTSTSANIGGETQEWISGISLLTGANLGTERKVFEGLPRSLSDHLTNSIAYGPDGRLYFLQGSNQAAGDLDNSWGQRGEKLLTAATLVFDQDHPQVQAAISGGASINVKTADGGTYDPFAAGAPLQIYATGIRNAYDLVWHSNGRLYVPTNGTAGGANSPGVTANADGTFTRTAAAGIPGYSTVNGKDYTNACLNRRIDGKPYTGGTVPPIANHPTQRDHLYMVEEHGFYGHPNPERCEWVLHEGNDPANPPVAAGQGGTKYPSGVKADPNYRGIAYDLEFNKSPNGALEYQSETFGGQLKGRLLVTRFSNNNDLLFLQPDTVSGEILGSQSSVGLTGVPNSTMTGVDGFNDPLEVVEDPRTGNLYVNQYNRGGSDQKLFLLRVPEDQRAPALETSQRELVFSAVKSTTSGPKTITVTNASPNAITLAATVSGANAGEFTVAGGNGVQLAPGASTTLQVRFAPGSTVGQRAAVLELAGGDRVVRVGLYGLTMNGIEGGNEPPLQDVLGTLGYAVNVGWTTLAGGMTPTARGDEVLEPLFVKAGSGNVTMTPLAQYAPRENLPFGWYTGDGAQADRHTIGQIDISGYQSLLPPISAGGTTSFDPGAAEFGFFYFSNTFARIGYTEDRLNTPASDAHRARIYPAKDRTGAPLRNSYVVAFEDASNGDYQDYVFLVTGVRPASQGGGEPVTDAIRVNFSNEAAALPTGYLRDFGQPFGARTRTDQGTGLSYGWKNEANDNPIDLSVGGTSGPGNGRDRNTSQPDQRLDTLMHMQSADITKNGNTFNGVSAYAYWEIAVPNGTYDVTVAAGDSQSNSDPEHHALNVEGDQVIAPFTPVGANGSSTRHLTATARVVVEDGAVTVDAEGGTNTKINYIDIVPVDVDGDDPTDGAQVKVNFQTATAPTPDGWTADTGQPYDDARGFGWLDVATGQPVDRSGATRYRTGPTAGITFPSDPLLQTFSIMQNSAVTTLTNGTWEYAVPNGTYKVAVSVGDAGFLDSTHGVSAEGQPVVANFVPTGTTPFQTGVRSVEVTDGKLTLAASGTNTKINWVAITGAGLEEPPPPVQQVKVAFGPSAAPTPEGWAKEIGLAFTSARGYGWVNADTGQPVDRTIATRYRSTPTAGISYPSDDLLKSFAFLDNASQPSYTNGTWEYEVKDGTYTVELSVGDAGFLDSEHGVAVEGTELVSTFAPTGTQPFTTGKADVEVTDGRLTVTNAGRNTKINWITITGQGLEEPEEPPAGQQVQVAFAPATAPTTTGWTTETGQAFTAARGYGWVDADTGQPADRTAATRYRATPTAGIAYPADNLLKSFAFLDNATQPTYTNGVWEYALANGTYTVEVSVGDAGYVDSVHGVAAEGVALVSAFEPTGTDPFKTGTAQVQVSDGRLSLSNTGTNTKVNWVRVTGQALLEPTVTVSVNGTTVGQTYTGGPAQVTLAATAAGSATIDTLTYRVNGGAATAYTGPIALSATGSYVLEVTATDSAGRTTVREVSLEVLDVGGTLALRNELVTRQGGAPIPGMADDWVTLHRINSGVGAHKVIDTGTVTVTNTGTKDLRVADVALTGPAANDFTLQAQQAPFTLAPGESAPVTIKFVASSGGKGIRQAQVALTSSDPASPVTTIQVRGAYMTQPEGGNEISLNQVAALFGWTTDIGTLRNGDEMRTSPLNGDEVRSLQWKRADAAKPVTVRQIAAFHGCCGQTETVNISGTTATHNAAYGQSILPLNNALSGPTQLTANPTGTFGIVVSGQSTNNANYMAVKTWPVIGRDGKPVAGAWIVGHDYISSPNQCGIGATNCDFQDNVYLVTNVLPVTPHDQTAPLAPGGLAAEVVDDDVVLTWSASTETDVAGYHVERALSAGGPWTRLTGGTPVSGTTFTDTKVPAASTGFYRVLAVDYSGTVSATATPVEVALPEVDEAPVRINAGGAAVTTSGGVQWQADTYFSGGKSYTNPGVAAIAGTQDDALYLSERSATSSLGSFGYDIPVAGGSYVVRLHFAEIYHGATGGGAGGTGKRVFSVNLEGGGVEVQNLDLNAVVPPMTAYVRDVPITVTDGNLDLDFTASVDQPKISAIEVIPAG
ncbi:malectin domain-containing carbohydrate-binding protein [Georgenia thermotolerans]|uniref:malectin domain-containing carbohydrate-binding protein n=1 Tax=Georgenia thermotolerans TaxID=527326 RepID=UPI001B8C4A6E|nr:malectin domain-containing carbohydrate-binding protein [Georgenia thermotolerans]